MYIFIYSFIYLFILYPLFYFILFYFICHLFLTLTIFLLLFFIYFVIICPVPGCSGMFHVPGFVNAHSGDNADPEPRLPQKGGKLSTSDFNQMTSQSYPGIIVAGCQKTRENSITFSRIELERVNS